jgi:hypothetical protein
MEKQINILSFAIFILNLMDVITTFIGLKLGLNEANPFFNPCLINAFIKLGVVLILWGVSLLTINFYPKAYIFIFFILFITFILYMGVTIWNLGLIIKIVFG